MLFTGTDAIAGEDAGTDEEARQQDTQENTGDNAIPISELLPEWYLVAGSISCTGTIIG